MADRGAAGGPLRVAITGPALSEMRDQDRAANDTEIGGLLLGWWAPGTIIVRHAIVVRDPRSTGTSWTRRPRQSRRALADALAIFEHPLLGYVGDWHCHPQVCAASDRDRASLQRTSRQYRSPLALIVSLPDGTCDTRAAQDGMLVPVTTDDRPVLAAGDA
jgi:hypothetical protein